MTERLRIQTDENDGKWLDHPRLGAILVAALKAQQLSSWPHPREAAVSHGRLVAVSATPSGAIVVYAAIVSDTHEKALAAVQGLFDAARADGHEILLRREPHAEGHKDFEIDHSEYRALTRFIVLTTAGPVTRRDTMLGYETHLPASRGFLCG